MCKPCWWTHDQRSHRSCEHAGWGWPACALLLPQAGVLRSTCVKFLGNSELSVCVCMNVSVERFLHLSHWVNKIDSECVDVNFFFPPSSMKALMFSRILFKYASEAGYPEHISRCRLTSLHELRLISFALCFLWSASHNVKGGDTCPFAISRIWSRYFLYRANATRSVKIYSPDICPSPFSRLSFAHSLSLAPPALPLCTAFRLLWAARCIRAGIWVMYKSIWAVHLHTPHPAFEAGLECPGPPHEAPLGGYLVFEAICLGGKKNLPVWGYICRKSDIKS